MNRWSLRNNRLKLETSRELPIVLEESIEEYASSSYNKNRKMSTCDRLDLGITWTLTDYICPKTSWALVSTLHGIKTPLHNALFKEGNHNNNYYYHLITSRARQKGREGRGGGFEEGFLRSHYRVGLLHQGFF